MGTDLVTHHVEQWAGFSEVIQSLLQVFESLPLLQGLGQLTDPAEEGGRWVGWIDGDRKEEENIRKRFVREIFQK